MKKLIFESSNNQKIVDEILSDGSFRYSIGSMSASNQNPKRSDVIVFFKELITHNFMDQEFYHNYSEDKNNYYDAVKKEVLEPFLNDLDSFAEEYVELSKPYIESRNLYWSLKDIDCEGFIKNHFETSNIISDENKNAYNQRYDVTVNEGYKEEDLQVFKELYDMNPNSKENDLYAFVAKPEFVEEKDGRFKKVLGIEKVMKIAKDFESMGHIQGLKMRAQFDEQLKYYQIWLPPEIGEMVENKGYEEIEDFILDAIHDKLKNSGPRQKLTNDLKGLMDDVKDQMDSMDKYNL